MMKVIKGFFKFIFKSILFLIIVCAAYMFYSQWKASEERKDAYVSETGRSIDDQSDKVSAGPVSSDTKDTADEELVNGMHREFVEAMDSYREFFHSYCEFMKSYDATNVSMLAQYADFMSKYADYMAKLEGWNQDEMNNAELAYYIQVTADIEKELAEVIQTVN